MNSKAESLPESASDSQLPVCESAERIMAVFFPRMLRLAKKKLSEIPCRAFDEEDIVQSAINSFFRGRAEGRFDQLNGDDAIWRLLATITVRKVNRQIRRMKTGKRGGGAVRGESALEFGSGHNMPVRGLAEVHDQNRMPETASRIMDTCAELLDRLPDNNFRLTAIMRLEGYSNEEIAQKLNCSVARTKQRLQKIREVWRGELGD